MTNNRCNICGIKWGEHCQSFDVNLKPDCVACGNEIKYQCEELYFIKGNYCSACNNKAQNESKSNPIKFENLWINKK